MCVCLWLLFFVPNRYKTQVCKFYGEGKCQRGDACTYLHGSEEAGSKNILSCSLSHNIHHPHVSTYHYIFIHVNVYPYMYSYCFI